MRAVTNAAREGVVDREHRLTLIAGNGYHGIRRTQFQLRAKHSLLCSRPVLQGALGDSQSG